MDPNDKVYFFTTKIDFNALLNVQFPPNHLIENSKSYGGFPIDIRTEIRYLIIFWTGF